MQDKRMQLIVSLHERFGRRLNDQAFEDYAEATREFDISILSGAAKHLRMSAKALPTPYELQSACREVRNKREQDHSSLPSELICKYHSESESVWSRQLCSVMNVEDAAAAKVQGWPPVCSWHYACLTAKTWPNSLAARMVQHTLRDVRKIGSLRNS